MTDPTAEFQFLADEAAEVGRITPLPEVRRVTVPRAEGDVSALVWGEAPSVTLLHGAGLNAHTWDATVLRLDRPAIALDLPGHGDSAWRDDIDYSPGQNARAVADALDALAPGVPQVIVGQSLGGLTALALAAERPDLVAGIVLVDISPGVTRDDAVQVTSFLAGPLVFSDREDIVNAAIAAGIGADVTKLRRGVALNTKVRDDGSVVFSHHLGALRPGEFDLDFGDLWPALDAFDGPVLLVRGSKGFLRPEVVREFRSRVPRAISIELDAGHNVQEQAPAELADAIGVFLAG